jgi:hypothetical protein
MEPHLDNTYHEGHNALFKLEHAVQNSNGYLNMDRRSDGTTIR